MIPFGIKVLFYRSAVYMLKVGVWCLPIREPRLFTGPGRSIHLCKAIAARGTKSLLVVTDAMLVELGLLDKMLETLQRGGVSVVVYDKITPNPSIAQIEDGLEARQDMALAAYCAGVAFTSAGVGYVHAIAHNFGALYRTPHGLANAIVMPHVLEYSKPFCTSGWPSRPRSADCVSRATPPMSWPTSLSPGFGR